MRADRADMVMIAWLRSQDELCTIAIHEFRQSASSRRPGHTRRAYLQVHSHLNTEGALAFCRQGDPPAGGSRNRTVTRAWRPGSGRPSDGGAAAPGCWPRPGEAAASPRAARHAETPVATGTPGACPRPRRYPAGSDERCGKPQRRHRSADGLAPAATRAQDAQALTESGTRVPRWRPGPSGP